MRTPLSSRTRKTAMLKNLIVRPELSFLMEAHNGLSAKIAEEAGFEGIWASGLSISAALGVRDSNEASWTQVLEVLEFMSDATHVPILVDGDTGYGNFNTMRRVVRKLESRDIAGVCIEDKLFPKTNSFIKGTAQPLADMDEFCGKIKAGKDAQVDDDFVIVARVEAFIAGWGLEEALKRAEAYRLAGADAILIHSALRNPTEILEFKQEWGNRSPVVIVPTKYYTTPTEIFKDAGFSTIIWANHLMRSAMTVMQQTAAQIFKDQNLLNVEEKVVGLAEVFRIQGEAELSEAEKIYLPQSAGQTKAIILAASRGVELGDLTLHQPKAMIPINGRPILLHIADAYREAGVKDLTVIRGYKKEAIKLTGIKVVDNDDFSTTQEVYSLYQAAKELEGSCVISYGDVLFKKHLVTELLESKADFAVMVDTNWKDSRNKGRTADFVICSEPLSKKSFLSTVTLKEFVASIDGPTIHGEWMGVLRASSAGAAILKKSLESWACEDLAGLKAAKLPDLMKRLIQAGHTIQVMYTSGRWLDVDSVEDVVTGGRDFS